MQLVADTVGNNADAVGNIADGVENIADGVGNQFLPSLVPESKGGKTKCDKLSYST